jgi:ABC-type lipoprotein export system ATPase subunit
VPGPDTRAVDSSPVANNPAAADHPGDLVVARHLTRVIGAGQRIIDDVSFSVPRFSLFAINGPSGSGKSTLLNLMTGIDHPSAGQIVVDGDSLTASSENALARWRGRHVGIVFQFFRLIPTLTAFENVRLPSELPGGQQQRVAIARAIANDPPLICTDEPTGNLDSKTAASVFGLLENLTAVGKTVVYVTHDRELAARAAASIDLLDGRIVDRWERPCRAGAPS